VLIKQGRQRLSKKKLNAKAQRPEAAKKVEKRSFNFHFGLKKYLPLLFAASDLCAFAFNFFY